MLSNHRKRLDKLENKTRVQWQEEVTQYWEEIYSRFTMRERGDAEAVIQKWFASPPEHKADDAIEQHFTGAEIVLLKQIDAIWQEPYITTMREEIDTLYAALQTCERSRV